jgi:hypothetical protein
MQTEVTEIDPRGTADDIDFVICDPVGDSLERLRSVFYRAVDARPTRDITTFSLRKDVWSCRTTARQRLMMVRFTTSASSTNRTFCAQV